MYRIVFKREDALIASLVLKFEYDSLESKTSQSSSLKITEQ